MNTPSPPPPSAPHAAPDPSRLKIVTGGHERADDGVVIRPVISWRERRMFQAVPWGIYAPRGERDPNWVPPLLAQERELLGWSRHPFFDHAEVQTFIACRLGRPVGRLAALVNHVHNRHHNEHRGFFGFFECVDDVYVARRLFHAGESWLRTQGMHCVRGPVNPSMNHTCGLLVQGFNDPPRFLMTYNPPYYRDLLESCGYCTAHDLLAYDADTATAAQHAKRHERALAAASRRPDVVLRPLRQSRLQQEVETYLNIYNSSLQGTWGFAPLQPSEAQHMAKQLRYVIDPELAWFAEVAGRPVGAVIALPDYNQIIRHLNGRLLPWGILRLWVGRRNITAMRAMAMTMAQGYQQSGLAAAIMSRLVKPAQKRGIRTWECSWVLESNVRSRRPLERIGMKVTRTYRLYDKAL